MVTLADQALEGAKKVHGRLMRSKTDQERLTGITIPSDRIPEYTAIVRVHGLKLRGQPFRDGLYHDLWAPVLREFPLSRKSDARIAAKKAARREPNDDDDFEDPPNTRAPSSLSPASTAIVNKRSLSASVSSPSGLSVSGSNKTDSSSPKRQRLDDRASVHPSTENENPAPAPNDDDAELSRTEKINYFASLLHLKLALRLQTAANEMGLDVPTDVVPSIIDLHYDHGESLLDAKYRVALKIELEGQLTSVLQLAKANPSALNELTLEEGAEIVFRSLERLRSRKEQNEPSYRILPHYVVDKDDIMKRYGYRVVFPQERAAAIKYFWRVYYPQLYKLLEEDKELSFPEQTPLPPPILTSSDTSEGDNTASKTGKREQGTHGASTQKPKRRTAKHKESKKSFEASLPKSKAPEIAELRAGSTRVTSNYYEKDAAPADAEDSREDDDAELRQRVIDTYRLQCPGLGDPHEAFIQGAMWEYRAARKSQDQRVLHTAKAKEGLMSLIVCEEVTKDGTLDYIKGVRTSTSPATESAGDWLPQHKKGSTDTGGTYYYELAATVSDARPLIENVGADMQIYNVFSGAWMKASTAALEGLGDDDIVFLRYSGAYIASTAGQRQASHEAADSNDGTGVLHHVLAYQQKHPDKVKFTNYIVFSSAMIKQASLSCNLTSEELVYLAEAYGADAYNCGFTRGALGTNVNCCGATLLNYYGSLPYEVIYQSNQACERMAAIEEVKLPTEKEQLKEAQRTFRESTPALALASIRHNPVCVVAVEQLAGIVGVKSNFISLAMLHSSFTSYGGHMHAAQSEAIERGREEGKSEVTVDFGGGKSRVVPTSTGTSYDGGRNQTTQSIAIRSGRKEGKSEVTVDLGNGKTKVVPTSTLTQHDGAYMIQNDAGVVAFNPNAPAIRASGVSRSDKVKGNEGNPDNVLATMRGNLECRVGDEWKDYCEGVEINIRRKGGKPKGTKTKAKVHSVEHTFSGVSAAQAQARNITHVLDDGYWVSGKGTARFKFLGWL